MRLISKALCFALLMFRFAPGQSITGYEESVVRTMYGQLSFLMQTRVVGDAALAAYTGHPKDAGVVKDELSAAQVDFAFDSFRTGYISDIAMEKWGNVVTVPGPSRDVLAFSFGAKQFTEQAEKTVEWQTAEAHWVPAADVRSDIAAEVLNLTVQQVVDRGSRTWGAVDDIWNRYAKFHMIVRYQGRSSSLNAIFFFGKTSKGEDVSTSGNLMVTFDGPLAGNEKSFYPTGLLESRLREIPVLSAWLAAQSIPSASCVPGKRKLCCIASHCGLAAEDIQTTLGSPLKPK